MSLRANLVYLFIILFLLITPTYLFAKSDDEQEKEDIDVTKVEKQDRNEEFKQKREEEKQRLKQKRETLKTEREEKKEEIKTKREEVKETLEERKEELKKIREEAKEKFALKREEFKNQLQEIKDSKKKTIVERVDDKITTLNQKHTDRFANLLEKLSSILDRIELKTAELDEDDVDVSSVEVLVQIARDAIGVAQTEVEEQAGKDYVFEIGEESTLGQVISSAFSEFRNDMKTLGDSVKVAKEAVHESAVALKDLIISSSIDDGSAE